MTWTITALCDQPSGTRNMNDYSDPVVWAFNCALNVVSATPNAPITRAEKLQNFSGRARLSSVLWTFTVTKQDGVVCPGGGTAPSTDTYAFSDETMSGTHTTLHDAVCGMQPDMKKEPFSCRWSGLRPARSSVTRCTATTLRCATDTAPRAPRTLRVSRKLRSA